MANQIQVAEAQIIGFNHGSHGFSIKSLIESMGLTKREWLMLKDIYGIENNLTEADIIEIDKYFKLR